jgi:hypothetical protein
MSRSAYRQRALDASQLYRTYSALGLTMSAVARRIRLRERRKDRGRKRWRMPSISSVQSRA